MAGSIITGEGNISIGNASPNGLYVSCTEPLNPAENSLWASPHPQGMTVDCMITALCNKCTCINSLSLNQMKCEWLCYLDTGGYENNMFLAWDGLNNAHYTVVAQGAHLRRMQGLQDYFWLNAWMIVKPPVTHSTGYHHMALLLRDVNQWNQYAVYGIENVITYKNSAYMRMAHQNNTDNWFYLQGTVDTSQCYYVTYMGFVISTNHCPPIA